MAQSEPATAVDLAAGTTAVCAAPCLVWAASLQAPAGNVTTVIIYDDPAAASGNVIARLSTVASTTASLTPAAPIYCAKGCTAVVAGTNATAQVYYSRSR